MQLGCEAKTHATDRVAPLLAEVTLSSPQIPVVEFDEIDVGYGSQLCALSRSRLNNPVLSEQVADGIASSRASASLIHVSSLCSLPSLISIVRSDGSA
jgi:hypothetical protein